MMSKEKQIDKNCKDCLHVEACSKWTDFPKQLGFPICRNFRKQSEWISVDDRLPEASVECLVATGIGSVYLVGYSHKHKAFNATDDDDAEYAMQTVTHWMPLPEAPKGGEEE